LKAFQFVEAIRLERRHGSVTLAHMVLEAYRALADESENLEKDIPVLRASLSNLRPSMPLINRFNTEVLRRLKTFSRAGLLAACEEVEAYYRDVLTALVGYAATVLNGVRSVATLSHSNTVIQALRKAANVERVVVLESRPLLEGLLAAEELSDIKDVVVCVDAAAGYAVELADAVLVGADALFPDGSFAGKVGVKNLAAHSREQGKPFYVACDTWKYADKFENEYGQAEDLGHGLRFKVLNPVFEKVDPRYVTGYVTEKGFVKPLDVGSVAP
jgi:translation initiation factor 2B subunit (eIF-2B alpha/beta/delta family)